MKTIVIRGRGKEVSHGESWSFHLPPEEPWNFVLRSTKFLVRCTYTRERDVVPWKRKRPPERKFSRGEVTLWRLWPGAGVTLSRGRVTNNSRDFEPGKWLVLSWVSSRPVIDKPTYCASYAAAYYGAKRRAVPSVWREPFILIHLRWYPHAPTW